MKDISTLIEDEKEAQAALKKAEMEYKRTSLEIRTQIGAMFAQERLRAGLSVFQFSVMLGTNRMKVFSVENPEKVPNPFSVETMVEMLEAARKVADACESMNIKPVKRGRPAKFKNTST